MSDQSREFKQEKNESIDSSLPPLGEIFSEVFCDAIKEVRGLHEYRHKEALNVITTQFHHDFDDNQKSSILSNIFSKMLNIFTKRRQSNADLQTSSLFLFGHNHRHEPDYDKTVVYFASQNKSVHVILERDGNIYKFIPKDPKDLPKTSIPFIEQLENSSFSSIITEISLCISKDFSKIVRSKIVAFYVANLLAEGRINEIVIVFGDEHIDEIRTYIKEFLKEMGYDELAIAKFDSRIEPERTSDRSSSTTDQNSPADPQSFSVTTTENATEKTIPATVIHDVSSHIEEIIDSSRDDCSAAEKNLIRSGLLENPDLIKLMKKNIHYSGLPYKETFLYRTIARDFCKEVEKKAEEVMDAKKKQYYF